MKSLIIRIISAVLALAVMSFLYIQFDIDGLKALCLIVPLIGVYEINRILFQNNVGLTLKILFSAFVIFVFTMTVFLPKSSTLGFALASIVFCSISILFEKKFKDLNALSLFQAKSILGFFYVGLLPGLATSILDLTNGKYWFFMMLAVVFSGDTFAYIFGILWGNKKILPNISPKKTVMGSLGGIIGSNIAAVVCGYLWFDQVPWYVWIPLASATAVVAQLGDMFESMLKRVAQIKDSGRIMPGHGGILDRIDGVLFGAPVILLGAIFFELWLSF